MLYSEFVAGTGCKETEHNYNVYKDLEIMYMNSDMSKQEIYEYGKKLVDNSKTEKELAFEADIKEQIAQLKEAISFDKRDISVWEGCLQTEVDPYWIKIWKDNIKATKKNIRRLRTEIKELKWVLGA